MIVYCDTSALLKLYIDEPHSPPMRDMATQADMLAVCRIAWAEAHAAFARLARERPMDRQTLALAARALADDWPHYLVEDVSQSVVERAADYADNFALRGYDAVQLAACASLARDTQRPVSFACFDLRLNKAARVLGLDTPFLNV
ncbi:type II toxin-antitoxin system VapC family toxin [Fontimonas sp. SYSU GA230001]|uniref:type II toxin-antitoxin system VapC family toxin n=1 Tax=Fontimonas sp. SYSU GA230001 TaxID=3142450 RepID=UPI0032B5C482